jgi:hypothetical protein
LEQEVTATPQDDQYRAAIREADGIVARDEFPFKLNEPGRPEVLARWAFRYAVERATHPLKFCPHQGEARVRYIFGCEPNHSYCGECASIRHQQLQRDARRRRTRECDHCHQLDKVVEVSFAVAAVVVRTYICGPCMLVPSVSGTV